MCVGAACGDTGPMLLLLNTSVRSVPFQRDMLEEQDEEHTNVRFLEEASSTLGSPIVLQEGKSQLLMSAADKLQSLAFLEYDSDGDDMTSIHGDDFNLVHESDIEFTDGDQNNPDNLQAYAKSAGYTEAEDASFKPAVWNVDAGVRQSHNCYMYALNDLSPMSAQRCKSTHKLVDEGRLKVDSKSKNKACKRYFHKPGYFFQNYVSGRAKTDVWFRQETSCHMMLPMLAADSPAIIWRNENNVSLTEADSCPQSYYMAALFIHPKQGFHFYRRDHACEDNPKELCWSHKPGIMKATDRDASGNKIPSVLAADRNYGELNYSELCSLFCVPQNGRARTHSDYRRVSQSSKGGSFADKAL